MAGDRRVPFGSICHHSAFGPRFSSADYAADGNVATLRTTDISPDGRIEYTTMPVARLDERRFAPHYLQKDDLVITRTGRVGTTAVFSDYRLPVVPGAFLIRFRLDRSIAVPKFYCYYFNSRDGQAQIASVATGSVQQNLNITGLHGLEVPLPTVAVQHRIAHILGTLDDKIELNRRMNATLEGISRALFKSWFVDFDPVRQKAAGQQPVGMDAQTAALFPDSFEDSEIGEVPKGWGEGCLGDVAEIMRRSAHPDEITFDTPYIALEHMPRRCIALSEWNSAATVESNKSRFERGEILFGKLRPYFHKVGVAPLDGVCSTDIVVVRPKSPHCFGYVLGHMSSDTFVAYTNAGSTGTKMPRTNWEDMSKYGVVLPPDKLMRAFDAIVKDAVNSMNSRVFQCRSLAALRDTLLPKLLSGEILVPDTEQVVEEAIACLPAVVDSL
jgi:type I restriction enzyme S subunit